MREYRYPFWPALTHAVLLIGLCVGVGVYLWVLGESLGSDLSYLGLWPWWLRSLLWLIPSLLLGVCVGAVYLEGKALAFMLRYRRTRFVLHEDGITVAHGSSSTTFRWNEVSICRSHLGAVRVFTATEERWVMPADRELREMVDEAVARSRPCGSDAPG